MATPVIYQLPTPLTGSVGILPVYKYMVCGDTLAAVTTAGYLNQINLEGYPLTQTDIVNLIYAFNPNTQSGTFEQFSVSISGGVITLNPLSNAGEVTLPTIANHIATYTNTAGHLSEDPATAISGGNIQAGLSGTAGFVASFPATAARGSLRLTAVANTGDTLVTISNVLHGQASVYSIPDAANAIGRFLVGATATPFVSGNFPVASGTGGLMVDSGKSAAALPTFTSPTIASHIAVFTNTTGNLGEDAATAINGGNIQAGLSGTAGTVASFPATAANGSLILAGVAAGGAFNTTISNGTMGQSTVYTLGDIGAPTGGLVVSTTVIRQKTVVGAAAAGGAAAQSFTDAFCTSASVVIGNWATQTTPASVLTIVPGTGSFIVTSSADAGVGTFSYTIYK